MKPVKRHKKSKYIFKSRWKRIALGVLDALGKAIFIGRRKKPWDLSGVRKILLVRMDQIGDVVFASPVLEYLHKLMPEASIDFLTGPWAAPLVKNFPYVSNVLVFEGNWFSPNAHWSECLVHARKMLKELRGNHYDLGIDLRGDMRNIALMRAAGVHRILGYGITGGKFLLDRTAPYDFSAHQVELNLRLIGEVAKGAGQGAAPVPSKEQSGPRLFCPEVAKEAVFDHGWISRGHPRILIHAEAGYPSKRWNKARFVQLAAMLCERGANVGLIGLESDGLCNGPELSRHAHRIMDLRGKTNLLELCALIAQSDLLIGNDSAPAQIAAGLGTSCIVLFSGANDPVRWRPLGNNVHLLFHPVKCSPCESPACLMSTHECMDAITVHEVEGLVQEILRAKGMAIQT